MVLLNTVDCTHKTQTNTTKAVRNIWPENLTLSRTQPLLDPRIILSLDCIEMKKIHIKHIHQHKHIHQLHVYLESNMNYFNKQDFSAYINFNGIDRLAQKVNLMHFYSIYCPRHAKQKKETQTGRLLEKKNPGMLGKDDTFKLL